jgi:hypothetical protein
MIKKIICIQMLVFTLSLILLIAISGCKSEPKESLPTIISSSKNSSAEYPYILAIETCPYGEENDSAPGLCRLYTDKNSNHICDYS